MYNKEVIKPDYKMAKTRTITATFEDGKTIERVTGRIYTHAVTNGRQTTWCGRPDLMLKAKARLPRKYWIGVESRYEEVTVKVAEVTNDPWNFQKLH